MVTAISARNLEPDSEDWDLIKYFPGMASQAVTEPDSEDWDLIKYFPGMASQAITGLAADTQANVISPSARAPHRHGARRTPRGSSPPSRTEGQSTGYTGRLGHPHVRHRGRYHPLGRGVQKAHTLPNWLDVVPRSEADWG